MRLSNASVILLFGLATLAKAESTSTETQASTQIVETETHETEHVEINGQEEHDSEMENGDHEEKHESERESENSAKHPKRNHQIVKFESHTIKAKAFSRSLSNSSVLKFFFSTNGFPRLRVSAYTRDGESESSFTARSGLFAIVEKGDDSPLTLTDVLNGFRLVGRSDDWTDMRMTNETTAGNATVRTISTSLQGQGTYQNTTVSLDVLITTDKVNSTDLGERQRFILDPNSLKYDVTIDNWAFQHDNATLYIIQGLWSKTFGEDIVQGNFVNVTNGDGSFSWSPVISTDGVDAIIETSQINFDLNQRESHEEEHEEDDEEESPAEQIRLFAHKFHAPRGTSKMVWDPQISADNAVTLGKSSDAVSVKSSLWISFAAVAVAMLTLF